MGTLVVLGIGEYFLAGVKSKVVGLILPTLTWLVAIGIIAGMVINMPSIPVGESGVGYAGNDYAVNSYVIHDENSDTTYFSTAYVENRVTGEKFYTPVEFNEKGKLINYDRKLAQYKRGIESITNCDSTIVGKSTTYKEMRKLYIEKNGNPNIPAYINILLQLIIPGIVTAIYIFVRRRKARIASEDELEKMTIRDI